MQFFTAILAGAAAVSAFSTPVQKRDLASIQSSLDEISAATTKLSSAVSSFSGIGQVASLQSSTEALINSIKEGTTNAGTTPLSQSDALQLAQPIQDLSDMTTSAINGVIAKKSQFESLGVAGIVYDELTQIKSAASAFSSAVIKLVPASLQSTAQQLAQPLLDAIDKGIAAYKSDAGATGGSGSTSSSAAAPTSASSTEAATTTSAATTAAPTTTVVPSSVSTSAVVATTIASSNGTYPIPSPTAPLAGGAAINAGSVGAVAAAILAAVAAF